MTSTNKLEQPVREKTGSKTGAKAALPNGAKTDAKAAKPKKSQRARLVKLVIQPHLVIEEGGEIVNEAAIRPFEVSAKQVREGWTFDITAFEAQLTEQMNNERT